MPDELTDQIHQRVAEKSATLCDLGVLMEKAAESISSDDLGIGVDEPGSALSGLA
jgi:hypothetical protein